MAAPRFLPLDPPLKVERVEWVDVGGDMVLVRCRGSWVQELPPRPRPVLVVRARGRAHRFPALPAAGEPGAPGTWRAAFAVPVALRRALAADLELELGGLLLALPAAQPAEEGVAQASVLAERRTERAERAGLEESARADEAEALAAELAVSAAELEERLAAREDDAARTRIELGIVRGERERARQIAWAEGRRREELEAELGGRLRAAQREREALRTALAVARDQRDDLRRRVRELERRRAEQAASSPEAVARAAPAHDLDVLRRERTLAAGLATGPARVEPPAAVDAPGAVAPGETVETGVAVEPGDPVAASTVLELSTAWPPAGTALEPSPPASQAFDHALARLRAARPVPAHPPALGRRRPGLWPRLVAYLRTARRRPARRS